MLVALEAASLRSAALAMQLRARAAAAAIFAGALVVSGVFHALRGG